MKLSPPQIAQVKEQVGAEPVPAGPISEELTKHFGDHTFYVDGQGLHIFQTEQTEVESGSCNILPVRVASWANEERDALAPHDPVVGEKTAVIDIEN